MQESWCAQQQKQKSINLVPQDILLIPFFFHSSQKDSNFIPETHIQSTKITTHPTQRQTRPKTRNTRSGSVHTIQFCSVRSNAVYSKQNEGRCLSLRPCFYVSKCFVKFFFLHKLVRFVFFSFSHSHRSSRSWLNTFNHVS